MRHLHMLALAAIATLALTGFVASSASATTMEIGGIARNLSVVGSAELEPGTSAVMSRTDGSFANTCSGSTVKVATASPYTGATVAGPVKEMSFTSCTRAIVVHQPGSLSIEFTSGTDGTALSKEAEVTAGTPFGTVNCKTGGGVHIGTITGVKEGNATLDFNAVMNCGFLLPSATLKATYTLKGALGVVS